MHKQQKNSRLENSKEVRRVMNRFGVDLTQCQYSVTGREIRITGRLLKTDGSDFGGPEVECLIQEFQSVLRGFFVRGEMENWIFSSDHIQSVGKDQDKEETEEEVA